MRSFEKVGQILQVAFTYIGTIVGAGFASGQEILQFYTKYGRIAGLCIVVATVLFIWLGVKLMLLAHDSGAKSYDDLNRHLLGAGLGRAFSTFLMIVLLGTSSVMLAGAGSLFQEQFQLNFKLGLLLTVFLAYWVLRGGMQGILAINSFVVPFMLLFVGIILIEALKLPTSSNWITLTSDYSLLKIWISPLLYVSFNLATSQAILVPLGTTFSDRSVLIYGGILGGLIIGIMLMFGHIALSAQMPQISQFDIPMAHVINRLGSFIGIIYTLVIFGEIFTTFVADVFGLSLQIRKHTVVPPKWLIVGLLIFCFLFAQFGFRSLLSVLYPLFGAVSVIWAISLVNGGFRDIPRQPNR